MNDVAMPTPSLAGGAKFEGPWQAQAFAMVVRLNATGLFGWDEWVKTFSEEITRSPALPDESSSQTYYRQWIAALEKLLVTQGVLSEGDAEVRALMWRDAYVNTPHGQPVELGNASCPPGHSHGHVRRGIPITISPGQDRL